MTTTTDHTGSATDPARIRRSEPLAWNLRELLAIDEATIPGLEPILAAIRATLADLLALPRPGCDCCGAPATLAYLDGLDAVLACDAEQDPGGYPLRLDDLVDGDFDWIAHVGAKTAGPIALLHLVVRLRHEERLRQLREIRAAQSGSSA